MQENYSVELGIATVSEMIEILQSILEQHGDWPVYMNGSDECFLCVNVEEEHLIMDNDDLFWEQDEDWWPENGWKPNFPWSTNDDDDDLE